MPVNRLLPRVASRILLAAILLAWGPASPLRAQAAFVRGDFNADGSLDVSDPVFILLYLFAERPAPDCLGAGDANDDGRLDLSDAVDFLGYLFTLGAAPDAPFPGCGLDPTPEGVGCETYSPCVEDRDPAITEWPVPWAASRPRDPYVDAGGRVWFGTDTNTIGRAQLE